MRPLFTPSLAAPALTALTLLLAAPSAAWAQHAGHAMHGAAPTPAPAAAASAEWTTGELRRIETDPARVTLRHAEIKSLAMPPMTMVFELRDPAQVAGLKVGDAVRFTVVDLGGGRLRITAIEKAAP